MLLVTDLGSDEDVRRTRALLDALADGRLDGAVVSERSDGIEASAADRMVDDLWPRLGRNQRRLVKKSAEYEGPFTLLQLANDLGRTYTSVRSSVNAPLARAIKSARANVPGAPKHIWLWTRRGDRWELRLSPEMKEALRKRQIDD